MKKYIAGASIAFLAVSLTVSSCKKHDDDNNSIVGTWELSKIHEVIITTTPPSTQDTTTNYTHGHSLVVAFTSGGRYTSVDYTSGTADTVSKGTYAYNNNWVITTEDGSSTPDSANTTISGNVMTITNNEVNTLYTYTSTMTLNRQ